MAIGSTARHQAGAAGQFRQAWLDHLAAAKRQAGAAGQFRQAWLDHLAAAEPQASAAGPRLTIWPAMIARCTSLVPSQIRSTRSSR
jgi:hypothetical protein